MLLFFKIKFVTIFYVNIIMFSLFMFSFFWCNLCSNFTLFIFLKVWHSGFCIGLAVGAMQRGVSDRGVSPGPPDSHLPAQGPRQLYQVYLSIWITHIDFLNIYLIIWHKIGKFVIWIVLVSVIRLQTGPVPFLHSFCTWPAPGL